MRTNDNFRARSEYAGHGRMADGEERVGRGQ
jgi:hypothetical protein